MDDLLNEMTKESEDIEVDIEVEYSMPPAQPAAQGTGPSRKEGARPGMNHIRKTLHIFIFSIREFQGRF